MNKKERHKHYKKVLNVLDTYPVRKGVLSKELFDINKMKSCAGFCDISLTAITVNVVVKKDIIGI